MTTHLLFDFFGTLVDYSPSRVEQGYEQSFAFLQDAGSELDYQTFLSFWSKVFLEFDEAAKLSHREFSMVDVGWAFLRRVIDSPTDEVVRGFVQTYLAEWNKGVRYFDKLPEMIERLTGSFELAIITNTHDPLLVPGHLERMGVAELFGSVISSIEVGKRKPSPDIFKHALRELQVEPERCAYVGDSYEVDYLGAQSVGIPALLIDPRCQAPIASTDRLESIFDLERLVGRRLTSR